MWKSPLKILSGGILISSLAGICNAMPRAATSAALSPTPSMAVISWEAKIDALREYILQQPDQNATKGLSGPSLQKTFADGECLQVRFYNWDCFHDIPYKMRGVVKWLDDTNVRNNSQTIGDPYRYYLYGYYADPDNGWNFYAEARLTFGACGNRGPQSACGVGWCVDKEGKYPERAQVPEGQTPYVDPNNRDNLCPWLKGNGTASHTAYIRKG
jgi:hypothetical protein